MCWMNGASGPDAAAQCLKRIREHESHNGDSWGLAYVEDGEIKIERDIGRAPDVVNPPVVDLAIAHTRLTTRGEITVENAHPFPIQNAKGETVAAYCHNGTYMQIEPEPPKSDSRRIAEMMSKMVGAGIPVEVAFGQICSEFGETALLLTPEQVYAFRGRFDLTATWDAVATTGFDLIEYGKTVEL